MSTTFTIEQLVPESSNEYLIQASRIVAEEVYLEDFTDDHISSTVAGVERRPAMLVAINKGGTVVGTASLEDLGDGRGSIEDVAVLESERCKGIGRGIIYVIEQIAINSGLTELELHPMIPTGAPFFYEKLGYEYSDDDSDDNLMTKEL